MTKPVSKFNSIIYVNYSPYENSGKIMDYLLENFDNVFVFSLGFYFLQKKKKYNQLLIYHLGRLQEERLFFNLPIPPRLVFLLLPLRSALNFIQIVWHVFWLKRKFGRIESYFTVNAFTAWVGMILRKIGIVEKVIFWVWDYYPPIHESKIIMFMRYIYWQFDKISTYADQVVFVNRRLMNLRKEIGILPEGAKYPIVPIGTEYLSQVRKRKKEPVVFGFIGVLKKGQGLDIVFDNVAAIIGRFPGASYEIIGSGPDEDYFKERAKISSIPTRFYGFIEGESFNKVLAKCTIGIATYVPDESNVAHFGDPGKIKRYLSLGIPVIATDVFEFSKEIKKAGAGEIIDYKKSYQFVKAVKKITANYNRYQQNTVKLRKKFYYKKIYPQIFQ